MSKSKQNQPRQTDSSSKHPGAYSTAAVSKREKLRAEQAAEARRARTRRIVTVAAAILAVAIIAVVATVLVQNHNRRIAEERRRNQAGMVVPPNADQEQSAIRYAGGAAAADAPEVVAYFDFQCPGCAQASKLIDPYLEQLADEGKIKLSYHVLYGLDNLLQTDHSYRAAVAASCADFQGRFPDYSRMVFANQPAKEGDGWTDDQLRQWAGQAGITGDQLSAFETCFNDQAPGEFVQKMQQSKPDSVTGTPTWQVDGKSIAFSQQDVASADAVLAAIMRTVEG